MPMKSKHRGSADPRRWGDTAPRIIGLRPALAAGTRYEQSVTLSGGLLVMTTLFFYTLARPEFVLMVKKPSDQEYARHAKNQGQQL